jgi:hypothetical protein
MIEKIWDHIYLGDNVHVTIYQRRSGTNSEFRVGPALHIDYEVPIFRGSHTGMWSGMWFSDLAQVYRWIAKQIESTI